MGIELPIEGGRVDWDVGMGVVDRPPPLRGSDKAQEPHIPRPALLHDRYRTGSRPAGGEHRIDHDHQRIAQVGGELGEVLHGLECRRVPVDPDVPDPGAGDEVEDAVEHDDACPEDRDEHHGAGELHPRRPLEGGLHLDLAEGEVPRDLVHHERGDLLEDLPELEAVRAPIAEHRELGLDQRVLDEDERSHGGA